MKTDEALAAEQAVEARLAAEGANEVRRHTFSDEPAAASPVETPAEEAPSEETVAPEAAPEETVEAGGDPAIAAYLSKYGGDVSKALQAAVSAQRKLGEMGNELGQKREQNAELEQVITELAAIKEQLAQPQQQQVPDQATVDWIDEQITVNPAVAPQYASQALQAGQPLLYQRIMRQWYEVDPYAATEFSNAVRFEQMKQEIAKQQPVRDENLQMQSALSQVLADNPEFTQYAEDLEAAIQRYPAAAQGLRGSQDEKVESIKTLFALAERDTLRAIALSGNTPTGPTTTTDVATATTSTDHPDEAPAPPTPLEKWREDFRKTAEEMRGGAFVAR